jgi:Ran GTPase-activating protein (RanGAP) involved in mRNA processing and transport
MSACTLLSRTPMLPRHRNRSSSLFPCCSVLKLSVVGPAALHPLNTVLANRLDRIVVFQAFATATVMRQGCRSSTDALDRWAPEAGASKEEMLRMLKGCHALEELDLSAIGLTDCEAETLAAAMYGATPTSNTPEDYCPDNMSREAYFESLEPIDRVRCELSDPNNSPKLRWQSDAGSGPGQLRMTLTELRLEHNEISFRAMHALTVPIAESFRLTRLELGGNPLGEGGAWALCNALAAGPRESLRTLGLGESDLGPQGMAALAPALRRLQNLSDLDLNANRLTARGATSLARGLRSCTSLVSLSLNFNFLGRDGAQTMAPLLASQESMTNLDLSFNDIGIGGAAALVEAMRSRDKLGLVRLDLSKNTLGARGAGELSPLFRCSASTLQYIGLKFNGLGQQHSAMIQCQVPRARVDILEM